MKKLILALLLSVSCACETFIFADESDDVKVAGNSPENELERSENPDQEIIYLDGHPYYRHKPMPYSG
ncbi:hypothetical protein SBV42_02765 [Chlamydia crocodili]|uniref:Lipoprotein n=1 Tax=Chlamydia crocodili TaxID=2766982 RepID=A0ABX8CCG6_9CHLA|nr:hypothetical protein [Chlamydia crocodili]QVE48696.1 hypothetical protein H9Q19_03145 [Chlamydia crocodili]